MGIKEHRKEKLEDKEFDGEVTQSFERMELVRLFAVGITFKGVIFKQAVLVGCYFRNCKFIRCDFTGVQVKDCNFKGAGFENCQFRYTTWERTLLDDEFLDRCIPAEENLARDLVRSLRVNFAQIGNYDAVNKAAAIEVKLTGKHLFNAAYSRQAYYRTLDKYQGWNRAKFVALHMWWKLLDLLWGNGESVLRVIRSGIVVVAAAAGVLSFCPAGPEYSDAVRLSFLAFWGLDTQAIPATYAATLTIARFVLFGLFMAILVKRLSRR